MRPLDIAEMRCAHMPYADQETFLWMFVMGCADAEAGADDEVRARELQAAGQDTALAGYIEGLASTRQLPGWRYRW